MNENNEYSSKLDDGYANEYVHVHDDVCVLRSLCLKWMIV